MLPVFDKRPAVCSEPVSVISVYSFLSAYKIGIYNERLIIKVVNCEPKKMVRKCIVYTTYYVLHFYYTSYIAYIPALDYQNMPHTLGNRQQLDAKKR